MANHSYTRGNGILEGFLAKKRAEKANSLILFDLRKGRILDIGCGSYPYFLSTTEFKEKYGIDPSVDTALVKEENIRLTKAAIDSNKLSFTNGYFDVVTMLAVFEHMDKDKLIGVLGEIKRVLKKNGILIITTPAPWSDKVLHFMARFGLISSEEIHEHKHNLQKLKIEDIIEKAGFDKKRIRSGYFEVGFNMWFVADK